MIGCGGRGIPLIKQINRTPNSELVAVCDPDTARMENATEVAGNKPAKIRDYRKLLERKGIDGVIVASPNYWHALHTIHACEAGKDVYVEKPVSFDIWSGIQMEAAAKRYGRLVQGGTQNRSDKGLVKALEWIRNGGLGNIQSMYGNCFRNRKSIGKVDSPISPPKTLDYDLWLGPCKDKPLYRPQLHYDWHWDFNTGNGDMGNQGPHELDLLSWFAGDPELPTSIHSFGGRFGWDDAGDTANMQTAQFELGGIPCTFEVNNMWVKPDRNSAAVYKSTRVAIIVTGDKGEFRGGRGGGYVVAPDGKTRLEKFPGDAGGGHMANFFDAIRSRRSEDLAAPVDLSQRSSALAHLANISMRAGEKVPLDKVAAAIPQTEMFTDCLERQHKQLKDWNVNFSKTMCSVGTPVTFDPKTGKVSGNEAVNGFNTTHYRKGFEIPKV